MADYEELRRKNMERNRKLLEQLGLGKEKIGAKGKAPQRATKQKNDVPTRKSTRLTAKEKIDYTYKKTTQGSSHNTTNTNTKINRRQTLYKLASMSTQKKRTSSNNGWRSSGRMKKKPKYEEEEDEEEDEEDMTETESDDEAISVHEDSDQSSINTSDMDQDFDFGFQSQEQTKDLMPDSPTDSDSNTELPAVTSLRNKKKLHSTKIVSDKASAMNKTTTKQEGSTSGKTDVIVVMESGSDTDLDDSANSTTRQKTTASWPAVVDSASDSDKTDLDEVIIGSPVGNTRKKQDNNTSDISAHILSGVKHPGIMTTGIADTVKYQKDIRALGGRFINDEEKDISRVTHLVCDKIIKTKKFLTCMLHLDRIRIVSKEWLVDSLANKIFLAEDEYILDDKQEEKNLGFSLKASMKLAKKMGGCRNLFRAYSFYVTASVQPPKRLLDYLIRSAGGKVVDVVDQLDADDKNQFVITCDEDSKFCQFELPVEFYNQGDRFFTADLIMSAVLTSMVDFKSQVFQLPELEF